MGLVSVLPPAHSPSLWQPRGVLGISPLRMRTTGAWLIYFLGLPLQYILLLGCISNYFPYPVQSILFAVFLGYHIAAPLAAWTYEARNNPYAFAPALREIASRAEESELLEANRLAVKWYMDKGVLTADFDTRPRGKGFRE